MLARSVALAALLLALAWWRVADGQGVVPVPLGPGWVGVYKGSCMAAGGFELDAAGAPTATPHCLQRQGRITSLPAVVTWSLAGRRSDADGSNGGGQELKYMSYEDSGVMTPPGSDAPDIWLPGGIMRTTAMKFKPAHGGRALGSQCVNMTFDDGGLVVTRVAVYKLGAATVYHEEGVYELATMTSILTSCRPADLLPFICNATTVSYRCVAHKDEEADVEAVSRQLEAAHREQQLLRGASGTRLRGGHGAAWAKIIPPHLRVARRPVF